MTFAPQTSSQASFFPQSTFDGVKDLFKGLFYLAMGQSPGTQVNSQFEPLKKTAK